MQASEKQYWCCFNQPPACRSTDDRLRDRGRAGPRDARGGEARAIGVHGARGPGCLRPEEEVEGRCAGRRSPAELTAAARPGWKAAQAWPPLEPAGRGGKKRPDPRAPSPGTLPAPL